MNYIANVAISTAEVVAMRVKQARLGMGMTQGELGEQLDLTWHTISRWERGKKLPEIAELVKLGALAGKEPWWFMKPDEPTLLPSPQEAVEVLRAFVDIQLREAGENPTGAKGETLRFDNPPLPSASESSDVGSGVRVSSELFDRAARIKKKTKPRNKSG